MGAAEPFFASVYRAVRAIPRGRVATYGQLARWLGVPRGARAVGLGAPRAARRASPRACPGTEWSAPAAASPCAAARDRELQRRKLQAEGVRFKDGRVDIARHGLDA